MRTLKTLGRDQKAWDEVAKAASQKQSGDNMDFGLLCFERGLQEGIRIGARAYTESLLVGEARSYTFFARREVKRRTKIARKGT